MAPRKIFSLRLVFVLLLCSSMLLLTLLLSYKSYTSLTSSIIESKTVSTQHAVKTVSNSIQVILTPAASVLGVLSTTGIAQAENHKQRLGALPSMAEALKSECMVEAVFAGYDTGDFFYLRRYSETPGTSNRYDTLAPATAFLLISIARNPKGGFTQKGWYLDAGLKKIGQSLNNPPILDPRKRNWFLLAQQSEGTIRTRPYLLFGTQELGVTMARSGNQGRAVLGLDILTTELQDTLADLRTTPGTEIAIANSMDEVLASTASFALSPESPGINGPIMLAALGIPAFDHMPTAPVPTNGILTYKSEEDIWIGAVAELGNFYGNPLRLFITIPDSDLLLKAQQQRETLLFFISGVVVVFLAGGALMANWMFNPIRAVINHLSVLSEFNFTKPLHINSVFTEISQLGGALNRMSRSLHAFQQIMRVLNRERDQRIMFEALLQHTLDIVQLERGAIYLRQEGKLNLAASAGGSQPPPPIELATVDGPEEDLITLLQERLGAEHHIHVLLHDAAGRLLGALCVDQRTETTQEYPYGKRILLRYLEQIAAAAAVGIETRQLIATQKGLLDGMILLIAKGIDAKSRYTWGHCNRVPELALMLARAANESKQPPFNRVSFTSEQKEEFRIAAWLHDCGKLTTPEYIVDKATKLETLHNRLHEIRTRFEVLHRDATIRCMTTIMQGGDEQAARQACQAEHGELFRDFSFVAQCNIGNESMDDAHVERLQAIGQKVWLRHFDDSLGLSRDELERRAGEEPLPLPAEEPLFADKGSHLIRWPENRIPPVRKGDSQNTLGFDMQPPPFMYNTGELYNLSIQKGTLNTEERFKINDHIVQTLTMLHSLPWPYELRRVPDIAGNHHETLDGKGYPRKLNADQLAMPERILALADVFEALTAPDRPYKEGKTLSEALGVLAAMVKRQHLDKDVFVLFLRSGVYLDYAKKYLVPELIDHIDVEDYLGKVAE